MRTLRLSLAGAVTLALLGGLGGAVLGEDGYPRSGVWVTLDAEEGFWSAPAVSYVEQSDGSAQVRGIEAGSDYTFSDDRLSGAWTWVLNEDCFSGGGCIQWGTMAGAGTDGTWTGWYVQTMQPDRYTTSYGVFSGAGGYAGLTYILHGEGPIDGPFEMGGVVYEGDPPPMLAATEPVG